MKAPPDARPPERVEHAVFSLVDNRHAAHRYAAGELVLDASSIGFARYTRFGQPVLQWAIGKQVGGVRASIPQGKATLDVPLDAKQAKDVTRIVARVHGKRNQGVSLKANGGKAGRAKLAADGWQTIAIPVEAGQLRAGENSLVLEPGGKLGVEWLVFAAGEVKDDPRAQSFEGDAIALAKDASLAWYITVPAGAELVAGVSAGCKVEVIAGEVAATLGPGTRVELGKLAGKVVPLRLTARDCARATITRPEIRLPGAAAAVKQAEPPRYIVLWIWDATRADKIPIFTPGARAQTPNLVELAKTSAVYRQYYVQGNESQVSHSTMWTSLYPAVHNVRVVGKPGGVGQVGKKFDLLAGKLRDAGYRTEAVTANGFVNEWGGYARGFDVYRNMMRERGVINGLIYGEKIIEPALERFDAHRANPLYLYIGTVDCHGPWVARKPWIDLYSPADYKGPFVLGGTAAGLGIRPDSMGCHKIPEPADIERMRAIYDSAISYQDKLVGDFVAKLKAWGIWDQTMLVITADHGEEWFEDGRCNHGGSQRDSLVRVPMLIHYPPKFPAGIVEEGVEAADLFPTMLDATNQPQPAALQGASMAPLAQGVGRGWVRPSYSSMYELHHAMRIGRWKLRVSSRNEHVLNDMVGHPEELTDVAATNHVERRMMLDNMSLFLALRWQWKKSVWGVTTNITKQGAAELDRVETR